MPAFQTSALQTPTYKLAKFLISILEPLTTNKCAFKDLNFATEIVNQDFSNFMGSFNIDSLLITSLLNRPSKYDVVHRFTKSEFKDLLSLATKEPYFIFVNIPYKQIDGPLE